MFVHARAPYCALGRTGISHVVQYACQRAGVAEVRAHRLRHGAATQMHRAGAGLVEIGQVLRHRQRSDDDALRADGPAGARRARAAVAVADRRRCVMSDLRHAVGDYVTLRRALGYQLRGYERYLADLVSDVEQRRRFGIDDRG